MRLWNSHDRWGGMQILLHWVTAVVVVGLFGLGLWMVDLGYYHAWYTQAPFIHKSIGLLLFAATLLRLVWRGINVTPNPLLNHTPFEIGAAKVAHLLLYLLLFSVMISGFLISTADGRAVEVFGWFEVPAVVSGLEGQADIAGKIHYVLAITLISLATLHALAAIKHHIIDKDRTLLRMLGQ